MYKRMIYSDHGGQNGEGVKWGGNRLISVMKLGDCEMVDGKFRKLRRVLIKGVSVSHGGVR